MNVGDVINEMTEDFNEMICLDLQEKYTCILNGLLNEPEAPIEYFKQKVYLERELSKLNVQIAQLEKRREELDRLLECL